MSLLFLIIKISLQISEKLWKYKSDVFIYHKDLVNNAQNDSLLTQNYSETLKLNTLHTTHTQFSNNEPTTHSPKKYYT